jgi:hypothetical protein
MKKLIISSIVIASFMGTVQAQNLVNSMAAQKSFSLSNPTASNVQWESANRNPSSNEAYLVRFNCEKEICIAYYDEAGKLLMSGRSIMLKNSPRLVQKQLRELIDSYKTRVEPLKVLDIIEVNDGDKTSYFVKASNSEFFLSILSNGDGAIKILKREKLQKRHLARESFVARR